jgi:hypothetical protein
MKWLKSFNPFKPSSSKQTSGGDLTRFYQSGTGRDGESVPECHSEPQAKNLVFEKLEKTRCFAEFILNTPKGSA